MKEINLFDIQKCEFIGWWVGGYGGYHSWANTAYPYFISLIDNNKFTLGFCSSIIDYVFDLSGFQYINYKTL